MSHVAGSVPAGQTIKFPISKGIAGEVARSGVAINIADAYNHSTFNPEVDKLTNFRTRQVICAPVKDRDSGRVSIALSTCLECVAATKPASLFCLCQHSCFCSHV